MSSQRPSSSTETDFSHPLPEHILKRFSELLFSNRENDIIHNPYDREIREMSAIEKGDLSSLQQSIDETYDGKIGTLAKDNRRNIKNLAIVNTTIACRAAIRGGIMPEIAFSLSDTIIQTIEETDDISSLNELITALKFQYARMVKELRESTEKNNSTKNNYQIEKCKNYILTHLHGRLTLKEIAGALSLNPSYLSDLFRRCEGITVTEYIRRQKINLTRNLLIYSSYSYSEIASYLGYASQSHLGKQFREMTGMTLKQYREIYQKNNF